MSLKRLLGNKDKDENEVFAPLIILAIKSNLRRQRKKSGSYFNLIFMLSEKRNVIVKCEVCKVLS